MFVWGAKACNCVRVCGMLKCVSLYVLGWEGLKCVTAFVFWGAKVCNCVRLLGVKCVTV